MGVKKESKLQQFFLRWNLTTTSLTDKRGFKVSDSIIIKAMKFIEHDCVRKTKAEPLGTGMAIEEWIVDPIEGYNSTAYTLTICDYGDHVTALCNCQWCCMHEKTCSHILAVLINSKRADVPRTIQARLRTNTSKKKMKLPVHESLRDTDNEINAFERWEN